MKRFFVALTLISVTYRLGAQTNMQIQYDFDSEKVINTVEHFSVDDYGNTFFFVDLDKDGFYGEIARCFNFWPDTKYQDLSLQVEYDWKDAILVGPNYYIHSEDYNKGCNLQLLYKSFTGNGRDRSVPIQFTTVWTLNGNRFQFTGYLDMWYEHKFILMTEPQIWYTTGKYLNVGGEISISKGFFGTDFKCCPRLGIRWIFD